MKRCPFFWTFYQRSSLPSCPPRGSSFPSLLPVTQEPDGFFWAQQTRPLSPPLFSSFLFCSCLFFVPPPLLSSVSTSSSFPEFRRLLFSKLRDRLFLFFFRATPLVARHTRFSRFFPFSPPKPLSSPLWWRDAYFPPPLFLRIRLYRPARTGLSALHFSSIATQILPFLSPPFSC